MDTREIQDVHTHKTQIGTQEYITHKITWVGAPYTTTIIYGARIHAKFIFRDTQNKLAAHTQHTFTCRYCDCNGCIFAMRKNVKQPKLRCHCKHIDKALEHSLSLLRDDNPLTPEDCKILDDMNNTLRRYEIAYQRAVDYAEEYSHKASARHDEYAIRTAYHKIQTDYMRQLETTPHLYAHVNADNYPYIHQIK